MGKGYNNFMCKKPFHPGSRDNIKRVWMARQKADADKQRDQEMRLQYQKEQELYSNRLMVTSEDQKTKLSLNFMYEAPPGAKKERQREDDEPEYKFEWQRNAPRESFAKNNTEIRDQPFGIAVRNVRCLKCHQWGHVNTDRECPLFAESSSTSAAACSDKVTPQELMRAMQEDGLALKQSVLGKKFDPTQLDQMLVTQSVSEGEDPEVAFLKSLSKKQKKKLLRKLDKLTGSGGGGKASDKNSEKHSKEKKSKRRSRSRSLTPEKSHKRSSERDKRRRSRSPSRSPPRRSRENGTKHPSRRSTSRSPPRRSRENGTKHLSRYRYTPDRITKRGRSRSRSRSFSRTSRSRSRSRNRYPEKRDHASRRDSDRQTQRSPDHQRSKVHRDHSRRH